MSACAARKGPTDGWGRGGCRRAERALMDTTRPLIGLGPRQQGNHKNR